MNLNGKGFAELNKLYLLEITFVLENHLVRCTQFLCACQKELKRILENKENKMIEVFQNCITWRWSVNWCTYFEIWRECVHACTFVLFVFLYIHRYLHTYLFIQYIFKRRALCLALFWGGCLAVNKIDKNPCPHDA